VLDNVRTDNCPTIVARSIRQWEPMLSGSGIVALLLPKTFEKITITDWSWHGDSAPNTPSAPRTGPLVLPRPCDMVDGEGRWLHHSRPECKFSDVITRPSTRFSCLQPCIPHLRSQP
jgi:hypothetical protein